VTTAPATQHERRQSVGRACGGDRDAPWRPVRREIRQRPRLARSPQLSGDHSPPASASATSSSCCLAGD